MFPWYSRKSSGANRKYFINIPMASRHISRDDLKSSSLFSTDYEFRKGPDELVNVGMVKALKKKAAIIGHDEDIIGHDASFIGPFGRRKYIYVDHTATGKAVKSIESFLKDEVLPHYANTHTTVSNTSLQTTIFRNEARNTIRQAVGAIESDEVIFCGSGATSAVHKLLHSIHFPKSRKLIVFVGPFEHHSNILPWREAASKVIQVPMNSETGQVDIIYLRRSLKKVARKGLDSKRQLVIGCFSAGSNVTGAVTDDIEITELLHEFGALAFWDYAAAAPHVQINMNPGIRNDYNSVVNTISFKDAIFFSGHKFLGGPQTPGVLVVKKHVLQNPVPHETGGGTVLFTTRKRHHYLDSSHEREEGGTPDIVGSIRLGLVFRLRNMVGMRNIIEMEAQLCRRMLYEWTHQPELHILGSIDDPRMPSISFLVEHLESGYFLHHNFIVALLNDLFGIQCRGGCMCAGPYAQVLLGIGDKLASSYEACLKHEGSSGGIMKPGFVRISLSYHSSERDVDFVIQAVTLIAKYGWKMLPLYRIDRETGSFVYKGRFQPSTTSLASFDDKFMRPHISSSGVANDLDLTSFDANSILKQATHCMSSLSYHQASPYLATMTRYDLDFINSFRKPKRLNKLRWFMLSSESLFLQYFPENIIKSPSPFTPLQRKKHDNYKCPNKTRNSRSIIDTWKHGSIPDQIYGHNNERRNTQVESERRNDVVMRNFYTTQGNQSSSSSTTSGYDDDM